MTSQNDGRDDDGRDDAGRHVERPERHFHGRRQGRPLRKGRAALLDSLLPQIAVPLPERGVLDLDTVFPTADARQIHLEIGFGGGEHLTWQAASQPDAGFIGCEVFVNGVASCLRHIDEQALQNVRIFHGDARALLDVLPPGALDVLYLLHPDPWPKFRHANRRFIQAETIKTAARLVKPAGVWRIATDHPTYLGWTLRHLTDQPWFDWLAEKSSDWTTRPPDWPQTRYEAKAIREGRRCTYLQFRRNHVPAG